MANRRSILFAVGGNVYTNDTERIHFTEIWCETISGE